MDSKKDYYEDDFHMQPENDKDDGFNNQYEYK